MGFHAVFTAKQLREFDGTNGNPIYVALQGKVYDVSSRPDLYGEGTGYHRFAGRNVTRSFAKVSLDPADIGSSELSDCSAPANVKALSDFIAKYSATYPIVGDFENNGEFVGAREDVTTPIHQLDKLPPRGEAKSEVLSKRPLIILVDDFLSQEECAFAKLIFLDKASGRQFSTKIREPLDYRNRTDPIEVAFLQSVEDRCNELLGWPSENDEVSLVGMLTPPGNEETETGDPHLGLHLDTNQCEDRYATVLIYLSEPSGGATCFPAASSSVFTRDAAVTLIDRGIYHTDLVADDFELRSAKETLLNAVFSEEGMTIEPKAGTAVVFWTRQADGSLDPASFHGGLSVGPGVPKITLQKFKEIPKVFRDKKEIFVSMTRAPYENCK